MNGFIERAVEDNKWELGMHGVLSPDGTEWVAVVKTTQLVTVGKEERQFIVFGDRGRYVLHAAESVPLLEQFLRRVVA